jgi:arsenate reductase
MKPDFQTKQQPKKVLFLCTGNSCRSQMAEAITNTLLTSDWKAYSAGTHPTGEIHPLAIQALHEIGIEHHGYSKNVSELQDITFNLVVTVCDSAAEECPIWLGPGIRRHHSFPDPAKALGSEEVRLQAFRRVRDRIVIEIPNLLEKVVA